MGIRGFRTPPFCVAGRLPRADLLIAPIRGADWRGGVAELFAGTYNYINLRRWGKLKGVHRLLRAENYQRCLAVGEGRWRNGGAAREMRPLHIAKLTETRDFTERAAPVSRNR